MNLLLIDKNLISLDIFLNGCNSNTKYVVYKVTDTFEEIKNKILDLGVSSFQHIGFVFENSGVLKLFIQNNPFLSFDENGITGNLTIQFIKEIVNDYNVETVDFLACDLLLDPVWKSYFEYLQVECSNAERNVVVRASNNKSGNLQHGGDWILESTNEDVTTLYFNENIGEWSYLLGLTGGSSIGKYNTILLNDSSNNIYTCGMASIENQHCLLRANGEFRNSEYMFNKNIIYISSGTDSFAFLTDETSNNLYVLGKNSVGRFGLGNSSNATTITNVTTNILNKKVINVCLQKGNTYSSSFAMYVVTDEPSNNLYCCGSHTYLLGLQTITNTNNVLQRITYLNQKVIMVSANTYDIAELITDEPYNNVYYTDSVSKMFIKRNLTSLSNIKAVYIQCMGAGLTVSNILTNETSNNLYVYGSTGYYIGLGGTTSVTEYTKVSTISTSLLNKKIIKIFMSNSIYPAHSFVLTNESSNNLYGCGNNTVSTISTAPPLLGINSNSITTYQKISNYSSSLLNKKVIDLNININNTHVLTDEPSNNLYSTGYINLYTFGDLLTKSNMYPYTPIRTFENVTLRNNILNLSSNTYNELLNKKINLIGGFIYNNPSFMSIAITNEKSLINSNIYLCGVANTEPSSQIDNSLLYFNRMKYPLLNKKFIKIIRTNFLLYAISDESKNNLYYCNGNIGVEVAFSNNTLLSNLSLMQSAINGKKIIDVSTSRYFSYFLTDETSNNLYGTTSYPSLLVGDGGTTTSFNTIKKINNNIVNKKVIKISNNDYHKGLLTDEPINNFYICGTMDTRNTGSFGNGLTTETYNVFTNITNDIISGKKFIDIDCGGDHAYGSSSTLSTFLISNESSNNLYACGKGYIGDGSSNTVSRNIFINVKGGEISGKKAIRVMRGGTQVGLITDEDPTKRPLEVLPGLSIYLNSINTYSNIKSSAYSPTLNRIVCLCKSGGIVYSNDAGLTWYSYTNITNMSSGNNIIWVPEKQEFYILGNINLVTKSSDGINWTTLTTITSGADQKQSNIEWSPELGLFCTTKGNSLPNIMYSSNGINWSTAINPTPGISKYDVKWIKELNKFYAISQDTANNKCLVYSTNGINWSIGGTISNVNYEYVYDIAWSKELNKICVILEKGTTSRTVHGCTSTDGGLTWTISNAITTYSPGNSNTYRSNLLWNSKIQKFMFGIFDGFESSDGINWTKTQYVNKTASYCYLHMNYFPEIDKTLISSDFNYVHLPVHTKRNNLYMVGTGGTGINSTITTFTNITDTNLLNKQIIDINCDNAFTTVTTNESINNIYVTGDNTYGNLGTKNKTSLTSSFDRLTYLNNRSYTYVAPVTSSNVSVSLNTTTSTSDPSISQASYKPKAFNIGNNNKITFPDPLNQTISIAPVSTTTAVQNYAAVLNVTPKNVVSGYLKLEPAGTTFETHVSLQFDVQTGLAPTIFFKSTTDTVPQLIPSTNTSANDVYYTYASSTGTVTLYTKHFSEAIVTQDTSLLSPKVDFNLSYLNVAISMSVSGDLLKLDIPSLEGDAIAEYYVLASDMRKVFVFQSDSDDVDTITNGTDIKYFVRKNQWPSGLVLNPCHAWVQSAQQIATTDRLGLIADNRELVKHDFIRHIAKSLFNTHLAVDLFSNEDTLKYDLAYKGHNTAWGNIWNSISQISDISLNTTSYASLYGQDASYGYYLTGDASANTNLCRQLLSQLIKTAPNRLQNLNTYVVDASKGYYSVPLMAGDSISFKLTLQPAPNQHLLVNRPVPVPARTYQIRINLRDSVSKGSIHSDGVNVIVNDTSPLTYNGSAVIDNLNTSYPSNY